MLELVTMFLLIGAIYCTMMRIEAAKLPWFVTPLFLITDGAALILFLNPGIAIVWAGASYFAATLYERSTHTGERS